MMNSTAGLLLSATFLFSLTAFGVPLTIKKGGLDSGEIFVECRFEGHVDECKIDTGGSMQFIKFDDFSKAYPTLRQVSFKSATGVARTCDEIEIGKFEFAGLTLNNQRFIRCDSEPNNFTTLGINQIYPHAFNLNLKDGSFELDPKFPDGLPVLPVARYGSGQFSIPMQAGGQAVEMLFDTGAGLTLLADTFVSANSANFEYVQDVPGGLDGTGQPIFFKLYHTDSFFIANRAAGDSFTLTMNFDFLKQTFPAISGIVGFNHLMNRNWYIDPARGIWAVE